MANEYELTNYVRLVCNDKNIRWKSSKNKSFPEDCSFVRGYAGRFGKGSPEYKVLKIVAENDALTFKEIRNLTKKQYEHMSNSKIRKAMRNLKEAGCLKKA
ncbi:MAG: hypothetical protein R6U26_03980 [Candidatus Undinarchaeales archaeon]